MSLYLKRLVSGKKARFRDSQLNLELDLAYVTDQIIVMGFPAVGVEGIYRNHRADVQRFLSARHGSDFWVFNFCPVSENAYHENVFEGRVSRYPFPDHHVPPFLYLLLVTREIHAWLSGSDARVAVLHCKAGKGRSGILACAYLLSRHTPPSAPIPRSLHESFSEWSFIGDQETPQTPPADAFTSLTPINNRLPVRPTSVPSGVDFSRVSSEPVMSTLEKVLDFHTSKRMKFAPALSRRHSDTPFAKKPKMGVSVPSQQRWLFYWSQVLNRKEHSSLRLFPRQGNSHIRERLIEKTAQITKVKLTQVTIRMREPSRIQPHFAHALGRPWASLARYSNELVDELECWEKESHGPTGAIKASPFRSDRWDKENMIRTFAQMSTSDIQPTPDDASPKSIMTYVLRPLNDAEGDWVKLGTSVPDARNVNPPQGASTSESTSHAFVSVERDDPSGILLDANRELCIKLFVGKVTLGWVWLIPVFHTPLDSPSFSLTLSSDNIDFTTGMGRVLVDVNISFTCHSPVQDSC